MQRVHIAIIKDNNIAPTVLTTPDNPTNGDMIEVLFPNADIEPSADNESIGVYHYENEEVHWYRKSWWNSPYNPQESEDK